MAKTKTKYEKTFPVSPDDPLAEEHSAISAWISDAVDASIVLGGHALQMNQELKVIPSGKKLLDAKRDQARKLVIAAMLQGKYWDELSWRLRGEGSEDSRNFYAGEIPDWQGVACQGHYAEKVAEALIRRKLPFVRDDFLVMLDCIRDPLGGVRFSNSVAYLRRALERYASENKIDPELAREMKTFATILQSSRFAEYQRYGTDILGLCLDGDAAVADEPEVSFAPPPQPAPAGDPRVLTRLKRYLEMTDGAEEDEVTEIGPDLFPLGPDSPLQEEHELISDSMRQLMWSLNSYPPDIRKSEAAMEILSRSPKERSRFLLAIAERQISFLIPEDRRVGDLEHLNSLTPLYFLETALRLGDFEFDRNGLFDFLLRLGTMDLSWDAEETPNVEMLIEKLDSEAKKSPLTEGERYVLSRLRAALVAGPMLGTPSNEVRALSTLINDGAQFYLVPGEVWADAVNDHLATLPAEKRKSWAELLRHALSASQAKPSAKWNTTATKLLGEIGCQQVAEKLVEWFPQVNRRRSVRRIKRHPSEAGTPGDMMIDQNADALKGLLWCVPHLPNSDDLTRAVTAVALSAYKKIPGVGPRAVKVGNAAVYSLSELGTEAAVGQLAILKVRVKFGSAQKQIEKAFDNAAHALGLPRDQIEELGIPAYGLEKVGLHTEELGDYRAELRVSGTSAELCWFDGKAKQLKSVPAKVKSDHNDDLNELRQSLKDIKAMLPAQRDRLDGMFLMEKSWPFEQWRERYHNHPLVGTIAQRLIWCVDETSAIFVDGEATDFNGKRVDCQANTAITLWHPIGRDVEEITAWREQLESLDITQPFKQAHREVYLLTDAERNTQTYSNRFAAHILRQHQFNALCSARGWKNSLRLMVDDVYPPATKELPRWGLRAEFWVEGIGDNYGVDTNESGVYLRLATDQVRFYRSQAAENTAHAGGGGYSTHAAGPGEANINEPLSMDEVPPLVLSEIMRDVDLFVGVASVGNDPTWQDGGPEGQYRRYWHDYSFGDLSGTATTRKEVLERLVPRLKIADRCSFSDRFLIVRGEIRTYKIHLGSGNILMEPNDQYLCIVPDRNTKQSPGDLYLPFEGDATLSVIISKALLLSDDKKIKDRTILSQINLK